MQSVSRSKNSSQDRQLPAASTAKWKLKFIIVLSALSVIVFYFTFKTPSLLEYMNWFSMFGTMASFAGAIFACWSAWSNNRQLDEIEGQTKEQKELIALGNQKRALERRSHDFLHLQRGQSLVVLRTEESPGHDGMAYTPVSEDHCYGVLKSAYQRIGGQIITVNRTLVSAAEVKGPRVYFSFKDLMRIEYRSEKVQQILDSQLLPAVVCNEELGMIIYAEGPNGGGPFLKKRDSVMDDTREVHALIARFTGTNDAKVFLLCGSTQWGTLATGHFIEDILEEIPDKAQGDLGIPPRAYEVFFGTEDFVFLITATYFQNSLRPTRIDSFATWTKDVETNRWEKKGGQR